MSTDTPAGEILEARLEDRRVSPVSRAARIVGSWVVMALGGGNGDELMPGLQLVVARKDSGGEVLRVAAGQPDEADRLLAHTRRDLETLTVEEFVREWRVVD